MQTDKEKKEPDEADIMECKCCMILYYSDVSK